MKIRREALKAKDIKSLIKEYNDLWFRLSDSIVAMKVEDREIHLKALSGLKTIDPSHLAHLTMASAIAMQIWPSFENWVAEKLGKRLPTTSVQLEGVRKNTRNAMMTTAAACMSSALKQHVKNLEEQQEKERQKEIRLEEEMKELERELACEDMEEAGLDFGGFA